jgi:lipid-A-disaccharide synthase
VQSFFRKVKYITLVNLISTGGLDEENSGEWRVESGECSVPRFRALSFDPSQPDADRVLFPEYLTCEDKSAQIAKHIVEWLTDPAKHTARVEALAELKSRVSHGGASRRAAEYILDVLTKRPSRVPKPHFIEGKRGEGRVEREKMMSAE